MSSDFSRFEMTGPCFHFVAGPASPSQAETPAFESFGCTGQLFMLDAVAELVPPDVECSVRDGWRLVRAPTWSYIRRPRFPALPVASP